MSHALTYLTSRKLPAWLAYLALALSCLYFLWHTFLPSLTAMTHSYPAYYTASRLVLENRWSPKIYNDAWFGDRVLEMTGGLVSDRFSLHPPTTSLLLVPIAWLDLTTARVLWQLFNLALLVAALWLTLNALAVTEPLWRALFFALAFLFPPMHENMRVGQTYVMVLFLFALAFWSEVRGKAVGAGIGLGLAAGLKLSGVPIWLLLLVRKQWRTLAWAAVVVVGSALLGLLVLGVDGWIAFFQRVLVSFQPLPLASHVAYQTTPSFFQRIFVSSPDFNPTPLINAPVLAPFLNLVLSGGTLGLTLWFGRRAPFALAFAATATLSVILFPLALEYHFTLLLLPLAVMFSNVHLDRSPFQILWLVVILLLLCIPMDWNAPRWSEPAFLFLAYPRLYGGWLLWLWLLKSMFRRSNQTRVVSPSVATR